MIARHVLTQGGNKGELMHYKTNRLNHDFQIAYFLAGSCHTPDAAYALLCDLRDDREDALKNTRAQAKRIQAKLVRAVQNLGSEDQAICLEAEADIEEIKAGEATLQKNISAAEAELAFINKCIEKVQPYRIYAHLDEDKAHEAAQYEEWKLQLLRAAENYLMTQGTVPADHMATMRLHPAFKEEMLPILDDMYRQIEMARNSGEGLKGLQFLFDSRKFQLPSLLEHLKD